MLNPLRKRSTLREDAPRSPHRVRPDAMTAEIKRLEGYCRQLIDAIDEFEHELRRCKDAAERAGGASASVAKRMRELRDNIDLNTRELDQARRSIERLTAAGRQ